MRSGIILFLSFTVCCQLALGRDLVFGISETTSPPLYNSSPHEKERPGILPELFHLLSQELHQKVDITVAPRGRVALMLLYGELDSYCYTRPDWLEHSSELSWSLPIFSDRNVLVARTETPMIKDYSDLKQKKVATVQGFQYPELEEPFFKGILQRSDSIDVATTMEKLELKRVDYAVMDELYFQFYKKTHPKNNLNKDVFAIRTFDVYCALSPKAPFTSKEFNNAIEKLKSTNQIQKLLDKYR